MNVANDSATLSDARHARPTKQDVIRFRESSTTLENGATKRDDVKDDVQGNVRDAAASAHTERTLLGRLRYFWSFFCAGAMMLFLAPPALLLARLAGRPSMVYPVALFGAKWWLKLSGVRVNVRGREHLDPNRTYIFVSNHLSYLDTAALFYHTGRRIGILAKKELLKVPIMGKGMKNVNLLAIDRSNRERATETLRVATERLQNGVSIGVFAEGTRARPGELLPFKKGAFYMARDTQTAIVPVAMKNTDRLMGKGTGVLNMGTMEMVLLPPVETSDIKTDRDIVRQVEQVRDMIAEELRTGDGDQVSGVGKKASY